MTCPSCHGNASKVIYLGAPMKLCDDPVCSTVWGLWSWIPVLMPISDGFDFEFYSYDGWYFPALCQWLLNG